MSDVELNARRAELAELVQSSYEIFLRRAPEPGRVDAVVREILEGRISPAQHLLSVSRSSEFAQKWIKNDPGVAQNADRNPASRLDPEGLRVPNALSVSELYPTRILLIGSCLSEEWAKAAASAGYPCEIERYSVGMELPATPAMPIPDYDFQVIQFPLRTFLPDSWFAKLSQSDTAGHERLFEQARHGVRMALDRAIKWNRNHGLLTFVFSFNVPTQNAVGRLLPRYDLRNPVHFVEELNRFLAGELERLDNCYFFDLNELHAYYGRRFIQDDVICVLGHGSYISDFDFNSDQGRIEAPVRLADQHDIAVELALAAGWRELIAGFRVIRQTDAVKMVVVDLDDTLWRGVAAEFEEEELPPTEGWPVALWESLLFLKRRGILLAIISKNDEERITGLWERIVRGRISLNDFVIRQINWRTKVENMADILDQVNLLPGSVVFVDDNPIERAAVKSAFPDMRILGGTPNSWRRILLWSSETQVAAITPESTARTSMVQAQVARESKRQLMSREEFLATLNVRMTFFELKSPSDAKFARALELINKTNQFNTTGRRWTQEELVAAFGSGVSLFCFEVLDAFTDYGLVGALIVDRAAIIQFVLSCRVMGLDVEIAAVAQIGRICRNRGETALFGAMVETERNHLCRNVYERCRFSPSSGGWSRELADGFEFPTHIQALSGTIGAGA